MINGGHDAIIAIFDGLDIGVFFPFGGGLVANGLILNLNAVFKVLIFRFKPRRQ